MYVCLGEYVGVPRLDMFARYCLARYKREMEDLAFRVYVTDALQLLPQSKYPASRYYEVIHPSEEIDAELVIADVVSKAGLVITGEPT